MENGSLAFGSGLRLLHRRLDFQPRRMQSPLPFQFSLPGFIDLALPHACIGRCGLNGWSKKTREEQEHYPYILFCLHVLPHISRTAALFIEVVVIMKKACVKTYENVHNESVFPAAKPYFSNPNECFCCAKVA
ncbi:hypothetical protein QCO44_08755 [Selenomonas sputigena]|uniref:Uncharacterized protein n=1 Tax=Selenomonas sputigena TaxID=69823 RepID=A0ABV3X6A1_9FIRM